MGNTVFVKMTAHARFHFFRTAFMEISGNSYLVFHPLMNYEPLESIGTGYDLPAGCCSRAQVYLY
jgi:hypothetical protein